MRGNPFKLAEQVWCYQDQKVKKSGTKANKDGRYSKYRDYPDPAILSGSGVGLVATRNTRTKNYGK